jgi:hypothetical protein
MNKTKAVIETEVREYVSKLKKDRGGIKTIEVKQMKDYVLDSLDPDFFVGAFVEFKNGEKRFVYRFENEVNNYANGKGYGIYSGYDSENAIKKVVSGWDSIAKIELEDEEVVA